MRILIVDDSRAMRTVIRRMLQQTDFDEAVVVEAEDGREALAEVRRCQPDLILANWNMPEMSGIALLETLQRDGLDVPLGFITSEGSDAARARAQSAGARFLISKPFTLVSLQSAVRAVRSQSSPLAES
jgi:two-component system, chemotaxis family, chemotaxis protein CheY